VRLAPKGVGRGGERHVREDPLRRRLREPKDPCFRSLALPVGTRAPFSAFQSASKSWLLREERRTRAPRASSLHVRVRDVEEGRPKRLAQPMPRGVATAAAGLQAVG
jgi:hypothetical protein